MMPILSLQNLLSWSAQVGVLIGIGALLPKLFRLRDPRSHLTDCYVLLTVCLVLPLIQPWTLPSPASAVSASNTASAISITPLSRVFLNAFWNRTLVWILLTGILLRLGMFLAGLCRIRRYRRSAVPLQ